MGAGGRLFYVVPRPRGVYSVNVSSMNASKARLDLVFGICIKLYLSHRLHLDIRNVVSRI